MEANETGSWLSLVDYSHFKGISLSTIRRSIKANRLKHKMEDGKYLIYAENLNPPPSSQMKAKSLRSRMIDLEKKLQAKEEEIAELKMLIAVLENQKIQ